MLFWGTRLAGEELQPYNLGIYPLSEAESLQGTYVQPNVVMSESKLFGFISKTHAIDFPESIPKMEYGSVLLSSQIYTSLFHPPATRKEMA